MSYKIWAVLGVLALGTSAVLKIDAHVEYHKVEKSKVDAKYGPTPHGMNYTAWAAAHNGDTMVLDADGNLPSLTLDEAREAIDQISTALVRLGFPLDDGTLVHDPRGIAGIRFSPGEDQHFGFSVDHTHHALGLAMVCTVDLRRDDRWYEISVVNMIEED